MKYVSYILNLNSLINSFIINIMIKEKGNIRWQILNSFGIASVPWDKSFTEYIVLKTFYDIKEEMMLSNVVIVQDPCYTRIHWHHHQDGTYT